MMKTLAEECLSTILKNLKDLKQMCLKNSWRIPFFCGDVILNYLMENDKPVKRKTMDFFNSSILDLSEFNANRKIFRFNNFDFLNGHRLQILNLEDLEQFQIKISGFKLFVNTFSLKNVRFINFNDKKMKYFMENGLHVEHSIIIEDIKNSKFFVNFPLLIGKSTTLRNFTLIKCKVNKQITDVLSQSLSKLNQLESFNFQSIQIMPLEVNNIIFALESSSKTLKYLKLLRVTFDSSYLANLIANIRSLQELSIDDKFFKTCKNKHLLFKSLNQHSMSLNKLYITCSILHTPDYDALITLLQECKYLKKFFLNCRKANETKNEEILHGLLSSAKTLEKFSIESDDYIWELDDIRGKESSNSLINSWKNIFISCSNLKEINVKRIQGTPKILPSILVAIQMSKNTIRRIKIEEFENDDLLIIFPEMMHVSELCTLEIIECCLTDESMNLLQKVIDYFHESLTHIDLTGSLTDHLTVYGGESISKCLNLKYLDVSKNIFIDNLENIISVSSLFLKNLETFKLRSCVVLDNDVEMLAEAFYFCTNLKELDFTDTRIHVDSFDFLCIQLISSKDTLRILHEPSLKHCQSVKFYVKFLKSTLYLKDKIRPRQKPKKSVKND